MPQTPIIDSPDRILGTGIDALLAARPNAAPFVQTGVYGQLFKGLRAQLILLLRRQTAAVAARRVPLANGTDLLTLVTSEIGTPPDVSPQYAVGALWFNRPAGPLSAGVIPAGTSVSRTANPAAAIPVLGATYTTTADAFIGQGVSSVLVPVTSTVTGEIGNTLLVGQHNAPDQTAYTVSGLFDTTFTVATYSSSVGQVAGGVSGGTPGASNGELQKWARFAATQTNGPTDGNAAAQVLVENGVSYFSVLDDTNNAQLVLYVADRSWASSPTLCNNVRSQMNIGFGCLVQIYPVQNFPISVTASVVVKDPQYLNATQAITANVQTACKAYFDGRDDWHTWSTDGLEAAITSADARIAQCTSASVVATEGWTDIYSAGATVAPPAYDTRYDTVANIGFTGNGEYGVVTASLAPATYATHWYLVGSGVSLTFTSY